jgi:magnesium-transporting ATPase (P-type)
MIIILLLIIAPILQIIASTLRIKGFIGVPVGVIMLLAFILGILCSFWAMDTMPVPPQLTPGPRCGMAEGAVLMGGIFLQTITAPLIAIVSYVVYRFKKRNENRLDVI